MINYAHDADDALNYEELLEIALDDTMSATQKEMIVMPEQRDSLIALIPTQY